MKIRLALALLLMLVVGGGAGYALGTRDEPGTTGRTAFPSATPVSAAAPRLPVEIFRQDPDNPTLEPAIPLTTVTIAPSKPNGKSAQDRLRLPVPVGWRGSRSVPPGAPTTAQTRWQYYPDDDEEVHPFGLRIDFLDRELSVESAMQRREAALNSALAQDSFSDLDITPDDSGGFAAVYVRDGYQVVSLERFFPGPDGRAYASVAAYGRIRDRDGLSDLLDRISSVEMPLPGPES